MDAEDEGRTEEPSEYRIEKARKEGRVAKSQEISSSLVLLFSCLVLILFGKSILRQCIGIFQYYFLRGNKHALQQQMGYAKNDFKKAISHAKDSKEALPARYMLAGILEEEQK